MYALRPCSRHPDAPHDYRNRCIECRRDSTRLLHRKHQRYDDWWTKQNGLCAFCGEPMVYESQDTHLDHDHVTGRKRGIVHAQCNQQIAGVENAIKSIGLSRLLRYVLGS